MFYLTYVMVFQSISHGLEPQEHSLSIGTATFLGTYTRASKKEVAGAFTAQGWVEALLFCSWAHLTFPESPPWPTDSPGAQASGCLEMISNW